MYKILIIIWQLFYSIFFIFKSYATFIQRLDNPLTFLSTRVLALLLVVVNTLGTDFLHTCFFVSIATVPAHVLAKWLFKGRVCKAKMSFHSTPLSGHLVRLYIASG